jgi:3-oxoacyl-[acyl-carrier-protein] synthase II
MAERAVVTGIGIVSALGNGREEVLSRLVAGERAFGPITLFPTEGYATNVAAEARGLFDAVRALGGADDPPRSRSDALAELSAHEALAHARLDPRSAPTDLIVGASVGGMLETELGLTEMYLRRVAPSAAEVLCHPTSAPADRLAKRLGPFVRAHTVCSACSSGAVALGLALVRIRSGQVERVLAGGVDALSRLTFTGFGALASLDPTGSRPFHRDRRGLTLGEAGAFFVIESATSAARRGATPIVELSGFAIGCEAHHITQPEPSGVVAEAVMRGALADAGIEASSIGYVSAHGTGTPHNDAMESAAIGRVFGRGAPVSSQKGQLGHTLAAAGALEAAITALAVRDGIVPPNGALDAPDPAFEVDLVGPSARRAPVEAALSNSFGFGGTDTALVLCRPGLGEPVERAEEDVVITGMAALGPLGPTSGEAAARYLSERAQDIADVASLGPVELEGARRLDLGSRYAVFLAREALASAAMGSTADVGVVAGNAFASTDASAAFFARIVTKGPRFAPPLDFPNLVPSSPGAHAAIHAKLGGPVLSVCDLETTAFTALEIALSLVRAGRAGAVVALAAEPPSVLAENLLSPACGRGGTGPRGQGGGALVVEAAGRARARGASPLARVRFLLAWRGELAASIPAPASARVERIVVTDGPEEQRIAELAGWAGTPLFVTGAATGWHEAAASIALAAAVARIARGEVDEVLVIAAGRERRAVAILSCA